MAVARFPIAFALLCACMLSACGRPETAVRAPSPGIRAIAAAGQSLFGGNVYGWVAMPSDGAQGDAALHLPLSTIINAPADQGEAIDLQVPVPPEAASSVDHIALRYQTASDGEAEFVVRFFSVPPATQAAIDCVDRSPVPPSDSPKGAEAGRPGLPPDGDCMPGIGIPVILPQNGGDIVFSENAGRRLSIGVVVTRADLLQKKTVSFALPDSKGATAMGDVRTVIFAYDSKADAYDVKLIVNHAL